jgi:23S rRNA pseudouridine1911/1915/1917 synthase
MDDQALVFEVDESHQAMRLDQFLISKLPNVSRTVIQRWIQNGNISLQNEGNSKKLKASLLVQQHQMFKVIVPPPVSSDIKAQPIKLEIIFEDPHVIVINKPIGMVVHPGAGHFDQTLVNALVYHCPEIQGVGGVRRPGLLQRLDKNTSGLLVVAKTDLSFQFLTRQLKSRTLTREYLAIVNGQLPNNGSIEAPIGRHLVHRKKMAVEPIHGKFALTFFRVLYTNIKFSLLLLKLGTGRTHQIRVHLNYIHHSIVGDDLYGQNRDVTSRPMLHSFRMSFLHPVSLQRQQFYVAPPNDFIDCLQLVGLPTPSWETIDWDENLKEQ